MFTPCCSKAENIAAASLKLKPSWRSGEPNLTMLSAKSEIVTPVFSCARQSLFSVGICCFCWTPQSA